MVERRRTPDRVLLVVTLALLFPPAVLKAVRYYDAGLVSPSLDNTAPGDSRTKGWLQGDWLGDCVVGFGALAAWALIAWRCRHPVPRGFALAAALAYAVLNTVEVLAVMPITGELAYWLWTGTKLFHEANWLPAVPLLAFGRRWGDPPARQLHPG